MKVDIWSDVVCPFCYIGKRRFEHALAQFEHKEEIEIQWHSFQLAPELQTDPSKNIYAYLAERKGWTVEYSEQVHGQLTGTAKEVGLAYNFDIAIPANTFNAHRLSHLAAKYHVQKEMEERLFSAYFTEGKNVDDAETLVQLGTELEIPEEEVRNMLQSNSYAHEVREDIYTAQRLGIRGVPFFVMNNKYAVSGAQSSEVFLATLQKAYQEFEEKNKTTSINNTDGDACAIDGNC
jgi:predicted DsbA family dithiol-disulfide isomerase